MSSTLRMAGEVLADQIDDVLDLWYGFVGSHIRIWCTTSLTGMAIRMPTIWQLCAVRFRAVDSRYLHPPV
jgi:hypothetical protein